MPRLWKNREKTTRKNPPSEPKNLNRLRDFFKRFKYLREEEEEVNNIIFIFICFCFYVLFISFIFYVFSFTPPISKKLIG